MALLESLWRNEQIVDAAHQASAILHDHPNCVKANWNSLGYLHWTQGKLDTGREYLTTAVGLDPDYGLARKLWANTPWSLDPAVTTEQRAPIAGWARDELVAEDLSLALPLPLGDEPLASAASRPTTVDLTAAITGAGHLAPTAEEPDAAAPEPEAAPITAAGAETEDMPPAAAEPVVAEAVVVEIPPGPVRPGPAPGRRAAPGGRARGATGRSCRRA